MFPVPRALASICVLLLSALPVSGVDFERQVQPILNDNCAGCHGGVKQQSGLSVLSLERMLKPADSGYPAVVPGDSEESELIYRIAHKDPNERMPPEEPLEPEEVEILTAWVEAGAPWPDHWSHAPIDEARTPTLGSKGWPLNEIDHFVLNRLEKAGVQPSVEAAPHTLVRRLSLDLTGLLPSPEDVARYEASPTSETWATLIDQYLDSPHYGERWARHWLDEARYADSAGYEKDSSREEAWRWREWVIDTINADMPFDQFTIEQMAGDLLENPTEDQILATYFHLNTQFNLEGGVDAEEDRTKRVIDRISTVGTVWLASTIGCAQCHDHPYDPVSQEDFFGLYAFFNNADETARLIGQAPADPGALWEERNEKWKPLKDLLTAQVDDKNLSVKVQGALTQLRRFDNEHGFARTLGEREEENRRPTYVFNRGDFLQPMVEEGEVIPATYGVLPPMKTDAEFPTRLDLAHWLVDPDNPLPARVTVNKVWYRMFGEGLSSILEDFGVRGEKPSHSELLDWMAHWWITKADWSRKELIRKIASSATYRQSSHHRPELRETDPNNRLLARQNRRRVEAEILRDISLQAAGLLSEKIGGPSVFPPLPEMVVKQSYNNNFKYQVSEDEDRYRRGLYTFFKRTAADPNLILFDCPDASQASPRRDPSNNPLQALALLNNEVFEEAANAKALQLLSMEKSNAERLDHAFQTALSRAPEKEERQTLLTLFDENQTWYADHPKEATALVGDYLPEGIHATEAAAWTATMRVLFNLDEFMTRE